MQYWKFFRFCICCSITIWSKGRENIFGFKQNFGRTVSASLFVVIYLQSVAKLTLKLLLKWDATLSTELTEYFKGKQTKPYVSELLCCRCLIWLRRNMHDLQAILILEHFLLVLLICWFTYFLISFELLNCQCPCGANNIVSAYNGICTFFCCWIELILVFCVRKTLYVWGKSLFFSYFFLLIDI